MKKFVLFFGLLLLPTVLASCTIWLPVTLFNNTGEAMGVNTGGDVATVAPNGLFQFRYPSGNLNWVVRLTGSGCEYLYDIPDLPRKYDWPVILVSSDRKGKIQVEKDFSINLLPPSYVGDGPAPAVLFLMQEGFPLRPVSKKCG